MNNVLIRKLTIKDASSSYHWRNDPEIWKFSGTRPNKLITEDIERIWLEEKLIEDSSARFAIIVDNKYVGNIQITDIIERDKGQYHIFIGEKSYWGKGIAKLATTQIIRFAKEKLNLKQLFLNVNPNHEVAIKLYEKCGFVKSNEDILMSLNLCNSMPPILSVFVMTFNHEQFIAQGLEGILTQKTNFDFEIVIGEDCSTDKTRKIVLEYYDKYPGKFKVLLNEENIGAHANQIKVLHACSGKYIAICEGDDFWTDPYKLQKQVDFLEAHPEFSICFHEVLILKNGEMLNDYLTRKVPEETDILELARGNYIHTPSVVFRNKLFDDFPEQFSKAPVGDYFLHMLNARYGKIKKFNQVMAVYRIHNDSLHSHKPQSQKDDEWLTQLGLMIPCFEGDAQSILINTFLQFAKSVLLINKNISTERQSLILQKISELSPGFLIRLIEENEEYKRQLNSIKNGKKTIIRSLKQMFSK